MPFGTQLGGGTDINQAVAYCQQLITRPAASIFILISDLFEGGNRDQMLRRIADMTAAGVQVIVLLALSDDGAPGYDHDNAAALAGLGVTAFACTPDAFPDLMAAAIERRDITQWAQHSSRPDLHRAALGGDHGAEQHPAVRTDGNVAGDHCRRRDVGRFRYLRAPQPVLHEHRARPDHPKRSRVFIRTLFHTGIRPHSYSITLPRLPRRISYLGG